MEDKANAEKKKLFYFIVLLLTFITMIVGAVFAYYSLIASQEEDSTVLYTGTLEINYIDGVYINNPSLYPINGVTYNTTADVYRNRFTIKSIGTLDMNMKVDLLIRRNDFEENALRYVIYNENGQELKNGYVAKSGTVNLTDNVYLASNESATYTLIIWLENKNYVQNFEFGSSISGKINVYGEQIKY